jgi:hypothetical protein
MRATKAEDFEEGEPQFTSFTLNKASSAKMCISMVNDSAIVRFKVHGLWANTCFDVAVIPGVVWNAVDAVLNTYIKEISPGVTRPICLCLFSKSQYRSNSHSRSTSTSTCIYTKSIKKSKSKRRNTTNKEY